MVLRLFLIMQYFSIFRPHILRTGYLCFGFVFIVRRPEFQLPASRYFILIIALFAVFCYTQELERLGRALIGADPGKKTGASGII
jgi:hypothetical protein